ncbi:MAG: hypothetical protein ABI630_08945 [Betaproteobacteria bacterium]
MTAEARFDLIVVKLNDGVDPAVAEARLVAALGAKGESIRRLFAHIKDKGPAAIEKGVSRERLAELKKIFDSAGVDTMEKSSLTILEGMPIQPSKPVFKCPACGHEQDPKGGDEQCSKCGVFERKFLENQKKNELYLREKEKMERVLHAQKMRDDKEAREAAEAAELEAVRKRLEEEMGLNKRKGRFGWLTGTGPGGTAARAGIGGAVLAVLLGLGWFGRDFFSARGVTQEEFAKQQSAQSKQNAAQMQNMVANLIQGSKKMAHASGAAAQFQQQLFARDDKDLELQEQLQAVQGSNTASKDSLAELDRAEGLSSAAKTFADSGGSIEDADKALAASMQSAKRIKDGPQRAEAVSAVAASQVEVFTQDARAKASAGDWRAADKSFSKALGAAGEVTAKPDLVAARSNVAKVRADTGDYGGATILFMDAAKAADELPDVRTRAIALADLARQMAQTTSEMDGAPIDQFDKALALAATLKTEPERAALSGEVLLRRVQATCDVAVFLLPTPAAAPQAKALLERAGKDADRITEPVLQAKALGAYARTVAEFEGDTPVVQTLAARIAKLPEGAAGPAQDRATALVTRIKVETMAAAAKFVAGKGEKAKAKQAFLGALKMSHTIATKSADPAVRSDVAKQRTEALSELARYMRATGDTQAAAKVFMLALASAGPGEAPKVVSRMVLAARRG